MEISLDPRVFIIVSLRQRGHSDDEIAAMLSLFDSTDKPMQQRLAEFVAMEDEEVVDALVGVMPAVREALMRGNGSPGDLIEEAVKNVTI